MKKSIQSMSVRLILFLIIEYLVDHVVFGRLVSSLRLSDLADIALFKLLTLITVIALTKYILRQRVELKRSISKGKWVFWIILGLACLGLTLLFPNNFLAAIIIGLCGAVPEELMYRVGVFGCIYNTMNKSKGKRPMLWIPLLLSSVIFAASHLVNLKTQTAYGTTLQIIQAFGMGLLFSAVYIRSQNILYPMAVHFFINFMVTSVNGYPVATASVATKSQSSIIPTVVVLAIYLSIAVIILFRANRPRQLGTE